MSDTSLNPVPEKPVNDGGGGNAPQTETDPTAEQATTDSSGQESSSD